MNDQKVLGDRSHPSALSFSILYIPRGECPKVMGIHGPRFIYCVDGCGEFAISRGFRTSLAENVRKELRERRIPYRYG